MSRSSKKTALERLEQALQASSSLSCEHVQAQLELLVQAESAGEDVDNLEQFQGILNHLDSCEECIEIYEQLSEEVEDFFADDAPAFEQPQFIPNFFTPTRQTDTMKLHVLGGLAQRFRLWLRLPQFPLAQGTLSEDAKNYPLFVDEVHEMNNKPMVSVSLIEQDQQSALQVAISDLNNSGPWEVSIEHGDFQASQTSNEQGITTFTNVPFQNLSELTIHCSLAQH
jgi:hypothetical protein